MPTKIHIVGKDIFNGERYEVNFPSSQTIQVPIVTKKEYTLLDVSDDGYITMMDNSCNIREDLQIDENLYTKFKKYIESDEQITLICLKAVGIEKIIDFRLN